ncbi:GIY-YIG nuclease family protein [Jeongeupia wiesaeckerbachi]|uniref:GIY-YIG nuclease family protein n=1 Tax=Jeongeupia wiesaeckerbachi TaxID=3051218 RepID=UPI003D80A0F1
MSWYVYLIECANGSLYTGISNDVAARYRAHLAGKGARYTRANPPRQLVAVIAHADRASASRAEHAIKQLSAQQKRTLCAAHPAPTELLAELAASASSAPR